MKAITSILLIFQILLSTLNLSFGMHFCGGVLKDVALFEKAEPCDHNKQEAEHPEGCPFAPKNNDDDCCSDSELIAAGISIVAEIDQGTSNFEFLSNQDFCPTEKATTSFILSTTSIGQYQNYRPPLITVNRTIGFQVFII